ncbi:MAG: tRNA pseudouridine(38-40) synthase TruA [Sedimentibacter sp.]
MVRNIKLIISYDGTAYNGWQKQLNGPSIQETIEKAASKVMKQKIDLVGSGRTDRGVHALGQVANFNADTKIEDAKIKMALNATLPKDIRIIDSVDVPLEFNSRYDAHDKTYMYQIYNERISNPFYSRYSWFVPSILDIEKMEQAIKLIIGSHDFRGFMATGSQVKTTVRTVYEARLIHDNELVKLYVSGSGFLYNMVRIIAGTLIDIGKGSREISCIENALRNKDRTVLGQTARPEGLFLLSVNYKKTLDN